MSKNKGGLGQFLIGQMTSKENLGRALLGIVIFLLCFFFLEAYIGIIINVALFAIWESYREFVKSDSRYGGSPWSYFMGLLPSVLLFVLFLLFGLIK
jgi:TRAP-type mannitol/chloroaromatic compound transport system permease small subunit